MIHTLLSLYQNYKARKRLAELVAQTRNSDVIKQYRKYRTAAKKGVALKRGRARG